MHDDEVVARTIYFIKIAGIEKPQVVRNWTSVEAARAYCRAMKRAGKKTVKLLELHHA